MTGDPVSSQSGGAPPPLVLPPKCKLADLARLVGLPASEVQQRLMAEARVLVTAVAPLSARAREAALTLFVSPATPSASAPVAAVLPPSVEATVSSRSRRGGAFATPDALTRVGAWLARAHSVDEDCKGFAAADAALARARAESETSLVRLQDDIATQTASRSNAVEKRFGSIVARLQAARQGAERVKLPFWLPKLMDPALEPNADEIKAAAPVLPQFRHLTEAQVEAAEIISAQFAAVHYDNQASASHEKLADEAERLLQTIEETAGVMRRYAGALAWSLVLSLAGVGIPIASSLIFWYARCSVGAKSQVKRLLLLERAVMYSDGATWLGEVEAQNRALQQRVLDAARARHAREIRAAESKHARATATRRDRITRDVQALQADADALQSSVAMARWQDSSVWERWQPAARSAEATLRVGQLLPILPALDAAPIPDLPAPSRVLTAPLGLPLSGGRGLIIRVRPGLPEDADDAQGTARAAAAAAQAAVLRLLATLPPGRARFTFFDPVGNGDCVAPFVELFQHNPTLVGEQPWTEEEDFARQLDILIDHSEAVSVERLRDEFANLHAYNQAAEERGEVVEAYRFLIAFDFPHRLTDACLRKLESLLRDGPRCGVFPILVWIPGCELPPGFSPDAILRHCHVLEVASGTDAGANATFLPHSSAKNIGPLKGAPFVTDVLPGPDILSAVGRSRANSVSNDAGVDGD